MTAVTAVTAAAPAGLLLPESALFSGGFTVLSVFVAINTVMYLAFAVAKMLPKVHPQDWRRRRHERSQTRSIHPAVPGGAAPAAQEHPTGGGR